MKTRKLVAISLFVALWLAGRFLAVAQETATSTAASVSASSSVPTLIRFSGVAKDADNKPLSGTIGITFLLYKDQQGGAPLWMETQNVRPDENGRFSVQLGSTKAGGLPTDVFASGEARWIGVQISGQAEQARMLLSSVPYALKAADAATIGGLPPSAFVKETPAAGSSSATESAPNKLGRDPLVTTKGGVVGQLPLWTTATNIQSSVITQTGGANIGLGTTSPVARLDVLGHDFSAPAAGIQISSPLFPQYLFRATSGGLNAKIWRIIGRGNNNFEIQTLTDLYGGEMTAMQINRGPGTTINNVDFPNGNVGIGTTTPGAKLDVLGNNSSPQAAGVQVSGPSFPQYLFHATSGGVNEKIWRMIGRSTNDFEIQTLTDLYGGEVTAMQINRSGTSITNVLFPAGNVGIGTTAPDNTLTVNGSADKPGGGFWGVFSDRRLKTLNGNFTSGLEQILKIRPVRYRYKDDNALGIKDREEHIGLVAQEVQRLIPEAVTENSKGYLVVNNEPILWAMLNAIKEQKGLIDKQENQIKLQQARIARLASQVRTMRASLKASARDLQLRTTRAEASRLAVPQERHSQD